MSIARRFVSSRLSGLVAFVVLLAPWAAVLAQKQAFEISAGTASSALREFGRQAGVQLLFDYQAVNGLKTRGLTGTFEVEDALRLLLEGTGLSFGRVNDRTLAIHTPATAKPAATAQGSVTTAQLMPSQGPAQPDGRLQLARADETQKSESEEEARKRRAAEDESKENVMVVTGTNIRGGAGPVGQQVDVITREDIRRSGVTNMDQLRDLISQNFKGGSADASTFATGQLVSATLDTNDFSYGSSFNLRGLGTSSTLTLLNGRRVAPAGTGDAFGISSIPLNLVERIEVVPDGGSAVYGSDAVGGVVNVITRTDFSGFETSAHYGSTTSGPLTDKGADMVAGQSWQGGNAFIHADYAKTTELRTGDRDFISPSLDPLSTLEPPTEHVGFFASANHEVRPGLRVGADALWSEHKMNFYIDPSTLDEIPGHITVRNRASNLSLRGQYDLTQTWTLGANTDFSKTESRSVTDSEIIGSPVTVLQNKSAAFELSLSGVAMNLPGGPLRTAFGALLRKQEYITATEDDAPSKRDVRSAYGELLVPVTHDLKLGIAARWDDYTNGDSRLTPKYGINWQPAESFKFRASYSKAFRSPSLIQQRNSQSLLFQAARFTRLNPADQDPRLPRGQAYVAAFNQGGNPDLTAEDADIFTTGVEIKPAFLPGFRASLTYFNIDYNDVILRIFPFLRLNDPAFADFVTVNPDRAYLQHLVDEAEVISNRLPFPINLDEVQVAIDAGLHNVARLKTSGFDIKTGYAQPLGRGRLDLSLKGTYVLQYILQGTRIAAPVNNVNSVGDPLRLTLRGTAAYTQGDWSLMAGINYDNDYVDDFFSADPPAPVRIDSQTTFDLGVGYDPEAVATPWLRDLHVTLNVRNVFDRKPPYVQDWFGFNYDSAHGDPVGRFVTLQLTKGWRP